LHDDPAYQINKASEQELEALANLRPQTQEEFAALKSKSNLIRIEGNRKML